jgi:hypothetical protein
MKMLHADQQQQLLKRLDRAQPSVVYAVEPFLMVLEEMALAAYVNYAETGLDPERLPYAPDWDQCLQYDPSGHLIVVTARKRDKLIGYALGLVGPFKHSKDKIYADLDTIWVRPDNRSGFVGLKLIKKWEDEVLKRGDVSFILVNSSFKKPIGALLKRRGYEPVETVYYKNIEDSYGRE